MAIPMLKCESHNEPTRIACVECGKPVCPKCMVRTEVGTKCETCATPVAPRTTTVPGSRLPWLLAGAGLLVVAGALVGLLLVRGGSATKVNSVSKPVGTWSAEPSLGDIRGTSAVVLLPNGQVLAAGGGVSAIPVNAAELYNPQARSWTVTGSLNQARRGATAVVLASGQVLVAGGVGPGGQLLASAELYDPATGRWTLTGSMTTPRLDNTLTLLADGNVLAAGGTSPSGQPGTGGGQTISPTASAEIYNPTTGAWSPTGSMTTPRFEATATLLNGGRVLIAGGLGGSGGSSAAGLQYNPLASTETYDPAIGAFTASGRMINPRADQVAVRLDDGSVLVAGGLGGSSGSATLATAERFDPTTNLWRAAAPLASGRTGASAAVLANGRVLVAGGESVDGGSRTSLDTAELFDPAADSWVSAGGMSCPRSGLAAVTLPDGSVLEVAGDGAFPGQPPVAQSCVERYFPAGSSGH